VTEYHWAQIREQAIDAFNGETPGAQLEQDILEHFTTDPERVTRAIHRIADQHQRKPVDSCWAVLRADLKRTAQANVVASDVAGRNRRIENAKRWIDNAGIHYDLQRHVEAELFGDDHGRGTLHDYDTPQLRAELIDYWHAARPRGVQAEHDHLAWAAKCKQDAKAIAAYLKHKAEEAECATNTPTGSKAGHPQDQQTPDSYATTVANTSTSDSPEPPKTTNNFKTTGEPVPNTEPVTEDIDFDTTEKIDA
jgi:hypothetical protein